MPASLGKTLPLVVETRQHHYMMCRGWSCAQPLLSCGEPPPACGRRGRAPLAAPGAATRRTAPDLRNHAPPGVRHEFRPLTHRSPRPLRPAPSPPWGQLRGARPRKRVASGVSRLPARRRRAPPALRRPAAALRFRRSRPAPGPPRAGRRPPHFQKLINFYRLLTGYSQI